MTSRLLAPFSLTMILCSGCGIGTEIGNGAKEDRDEERESSGGYPGDKAPTANPDSQEGEPVDGGYQGGDPNQGEPVDLTPLLAECATPFAGSYDEPFQLIVAGSDDVVLEARPAQANQPAGSMNVFLPKGGEPLAVVVPSSGSPWRATIMPKEQEARRATCRELVVDEDHVSVVVTIAGKTTQVTWTITTTPNDPDGPIDETIQPIRLESVEMTTSGSNDSVRLEVKPKT